MDDGVIQLEPGFPEATVHDLQRRGHTVRVAKDESVFFGGAQMAMRQGGVYIGASDPRRDGQAVGF
jgi:gamma-glutamyltranspeptidase/glutathione hydrolase